MNRAAVVNRWFGRGWLSLGYLFLYLPIATLVPSGVGTSTLPLMQDGRSYCEI